MHHFKYEEFALSTLGKRIPQRGGHRHMEPDWYLAQIKPNAQRIAYDNLRRQGFEVFLPLVEKTSRAKGFQTERKPLFPGYIFVGTQAGSQAVSAINSTRGISQIVKSAGAYRPIHPSIVSDLMDHCDGEGVFQRQPNYKQGDRVRVTRGPFTQFLARVSEVAPDRRVWLLLEVMGQSTRVAMPENSVVPET